MTRIPSTINSIKVIYENLPDIITQGLVAENVIDTLEQGKLISFNTSLFLIGDQPLENIKLKLEMKNDKNNSVIEVVRNIEKLNIGVNQLEKYILKTTDVSGNIRVDFIANENKSSLETDYSNNFGTFRTFIKKDKINPKLNVYQNNVELFQRTMTTSF
ncbi:MAG: hypothetical protein IPN72_18840 [Saprospiraceae bacterium]|nr:hypothetical protein [Saprospiraceae bacterium]